MRTTRHALTGILAVLVATLFTTNCSDSGPGGGGKDPCNTNPLGPGCTVEYTVSINIQLDGLTLEEGTPFPAPSRGGVSLNPPNNNLVEQWFLIRHAQGDTLRIFSTQLEPRDDAPWVFAHWFAKSFVTPPQGGYTVWLRMVSTAENDVMNGKPHGTAKAEKKFTITVVPKTTAMMADALRTPVQVPLPRYVNG